MKWPGLTAPPASSIEDAPEDPEYAKNLVEYRNIRAKKRKRQILAPLERGWTGGRRGGERRPVPKTEEGIDLSRFTATILELKMVSTMTATKGRSPTFSALVVLGDQQGMGGYGYYQDPGHPYSPPPMGGYGESSYDSGLPDYLSEPSERRFCTQCGMQLEPEARFCTACGAEV